MYVHLEDRLENVVLVMGLEGKELVNHRVNANSLFKKNMGGREAGMSNVGNWKRKETRD